MSLLQLKKKILLFFSASLHLYYFWPAYPTHTHTYTHTIPHTHLCAYACTCIYDCMCEYACVYESVYMCLLYYCKLPELHPHQNCTKMSTVALSIIPQTWKQPRSSSAGKRVNEVHPDSRGSSSSEKKWGIQLWETRRKLRCTLPSERSQSEKAPCGMFPAWMTFWGRQNCADKMVGGPQVLGQGGWIDRAPGPFSAETDSVWL